MNIHFIEDDTTQLAYFGETARFFAINDFTNAITDNGVIDTFKELVDFANSSNAGDLIITVNKVEQNIEIINQEVQQIKVDMSVIDSKVTSNTSSIENLDNKYTHILSWEQVD